MAGDKRILRRAARSLGLGASASLQKRAIQFGTRIANKHVCGKATLDAQLDLAEVVHPLAERAPPPPGVAAPCASAAAVRASLSKKRGDWGSARAAVR